MNTMNYKGCIARIEFDGVDRIFTGRLLGIEEIVTFHGESVTELENSFHASVDNYLGVCVKAEYDFSQGNRGAVIKTPLEKITLRLEPAVIAWFRDQVQGGGDYQSLINEALKAHIRQQGEPLEAGGKAPDSSLNHTPPEPNIIQHSATH